MPAHSSVNLYEATITGDVAAFERYFAQPTALSAALELESRITPRVLIARASQGSISADIVSGWRRSWIYGGSPSLYHDLLHVAVDHGQYDIVAWLMSSPVAVALHHTIQYMVEDTAKMAIAKEDLRMLEFLLASEVWATYPYEAQMETLSSLLVAAIHCYRKSDEAFELLLGHGADVARSVPRQYWRYGILWHAVGVESPGPAIKALARHGAVKVGESSALYLAAEIGNLEAVEALLDVGADPRARTSHANELHIHFAAERGLYEIVPSLLELSCIDIDAQDRVGWTALTGAVRRYVGRNSNDRRVNHVATAMVLLELGASTAICSTKRDDYAPLHWAVSSADMDMVQMLLLYGADPNLPSAVARKTSAHFAAEIIREGKHVDMAVAILELLVGHGADLARATPDGTTPYMVLNESEDGRAWLKDHGI